MKTTYNKLTNTQKIAYVMEANHKNYIARKSGRIQRYDVMSHIDSWLGRVLDIAKKVVIMTEDEWTNAGNHSMTVMNWEDFQELCKGVV